MNRNSSGSIDITDSDLPGRLRKLREQRHLSKSDLAEHAGLSSRTVHDLEVERRDKIQEKTLMLLATALEVEVGVLLGTKPLESGSSRDAGSSSVWPRVLVSTLGALVVILVAAGIVFQYGRSHTTWDISGGDLRVKDGVFNIDLWDRETPCRTITCREAPWDRGELLVAWHHCDGKTSVLACVDRASGKERWRFVPEYDALVEAFGESIMAAGAMNFRQLSTGDLDGDGEVEIIVDFLHGLYFPNVICWVDRDGRLLGQYASQGHLSEVVVADLEGDGRDEVIAAGVSNARRYQGPTVFVLDENHFGGATVDPEANPGLTVADSSRVRIVIPRFPESHMTMMEDIRLSAYELEVCAEKDGSTRIRASIGASQNFSNQLLLFLDEDLYPLDIGIKDKFAENISRTWPDSLRGGASPEDPQWRRDWLSRHVRFESGTRVR